MKKSVTVALSSRIKAALCCSAAVLLTACGGMADESANQQLLAETVASEAAQGAGATAAGAVDIGSSLPETLAQDTATPETAVPDAVGSAAPAMPDPAPVATENGGAIAAPATQATDGGAPASSEFNLNGYQASSPDADGQGTTAAAGGEGQQATQPPTA